MDLVGLYSALQPRRIVQLGVRIWPGTWPPCAVSPTPTQLSGTRTHDPESNEPPILAATNDETSTTVLAATNDDTSTTVLAATTNTTTRNPGKRPQTKERLLQTNEQKGDPTPDTTTFLILPPPHVSGGIRSEVTRFQIGRGGGGVGRSVSSPHWTRQTSPLAGAGLVLR